MDARKILVDLAYLGRRTPLRAALRGARERVDRLFLRAGRPPISVDYQGLTVSGCLRHRDFLGELGESYEDTTRRLFVEALEPGATVIDGGAHVGTFSLMAAGRVGPTGRVFSFEPDPYNGRALELNVERNGLTNVTVVRAALDDTGGQRTFYSSRGTVASSLVRKTYVPSDDMTAVVTKAATVDEVVGSAPVGRLVMKLDVEGAEERALRGAADVLARAESARVLFEHNPSAMHDADVSAESLLRSLGDLGFVIRVVDELHGELTSASAESLQGRHCNLVADRGL